MHNLHLKSWGAGVCLLAAVGCGDGRGVEPADTNGAAPDERANVDEPGKPEGQIVERADTVDGEAFSLIWGTDDDLWVLGAPSIVAETQSGPVPAILICGPERWRAHVVVRRNTGSGWRDMNVPAQTALTGLHGSAANNVWAVGLDGAAFQFDGSAWIQHDVRSAAGIEFQETEPCAELSIQSVFALSANDVWAVGYIYPSTLGPGLILHYDGAQWQRQPTGAPDGFFGVWASAESDAWAVGASGLTYHFDGTSWTRVDAKTSDYLFSVWGTSASDVWATGNAAVDTRFDGNEWQLHQSESGYKVRRHLTGNAEAGLWALQMTYLDGSASQDLLHWDNGSWHSQASFDQPSEMLGGLWLTPQGHLWGAGQQIVRLR